MFRSRWFAWLAGAAPVLFCATNALARAGGGQGYHGGGGGGFGGGHGGGGGGDGGALFQLFFWLLFYHPVFGVPVTLIILAFLVYGYRNGSNAYQSSVIRRGTDLIDANQRAAMLDQLRQADPRFDVDRFAARVAAAFATIQSAWSSQNLQSVRPFLSDGVHERFTLQIDEQKALGYRNDTSG